MEYLSNRILKKIPNQWIFFNLGIKTNLKFSIWKNYITGPIGAQ